MADRPILFQGAMVRAQIRGDKTNTRRVLKPQPEDFMSLSAIHGGVAIFRNDAHGLRQDIPLRYAIGDRLWVRESWCPADGGAAYMADHPGDPRGLGWKPSIHMPRWASRMTLVVDGVKVERVQDISEADAVAEGCGVPNTRLDSVYSRWDSDPRDEFCNLWDGINAKRGLGWDANPWVCALSFTVHHCNIDDMPESGRMANSGSSE